ncbi:hypothetical protein HDU96_001543 [Phlyctochytrium bullatum]|nr:hypothetical protein HDU96_001543 [Phlyctochytrium bullatum]
MALAAPPALTAAPVITPPPLLPRAVTTTATTTVTTHLSFCQEFLRDCANAAGAYRDFETVYTKCDNSKPESPMAFCIGCPAGKFSSFDACFDHPDSYPVQVPEYSQQMWVGLTPKSAAKVPVDKLNAALKPTVEKWAEQCAAQCMKDYRPKNNGTAYYAWYATHAYTVLSCGCSPDEWAASRPFNITGLDLVPALDGFPDDNTKKNYAVGASRSGPVEREGLRARPPRPIPGATVDVDVPGVDLDLPVFIKTKRIETITNDFESLWRSLRRTQEPLVGPDGDADRTRPNPNALTRSRIDPSRSADPREVFSMWSKILASRQTRAPNPPTVPPRPLVTAPAAPSPSPTFPSPVTSAPTAPTASEASVSVVSPPPPSPTDSPTPTSVSQAPVLPSSTAAATKDPNGGDRAAGVKVAVASIAVIMSLVATLF